MKFREARKLGPIVFRDPVLLCGGLYLLLYFDAGGFLRLGLLAAFLHEWGHILCYLCLLHRFPVIEVTMTGFCMRMDARARALPPGQLFWLAVAGASESEPDSARQCILGGEFADGGVQPAAVPAAGRCPDGAMPA